MGGLEGLKGMSFMAGANGRGDFGKSGQGADLFSRSALNDLALPRLITRHKSVFWLLKTSTPRT